MHSNRMIFWLLALSIGLRSLIAPGFMLDFNDDSPLGISITLCSTLDELKELGILNGPHILHDTHEDTQHDHHGVTHYEHEEETGLSGHSCGVWSPNTIFVQDIEVNSNHLYQFESDQFSIDYLSPGTKDSYQFRHQARAPPVSRLI